MKKVFECEECKMLIDAERYGCNENSMQGEGICDHCYSMMIGDYVQPDPKRSYKMKIIVKEVIKK